MNQQNQFQSKDILQAIVRFLSMDNDCCNEMQELIRKMYKNEISSDQLEKDLCDLEQSLRVNKELIKIEVSNIKNKNGKSVDSSTFFKDSGIQSSNARLRRVQKNSNFTVCFNSQNDALRGMQYIKDNYKYDNIDFTEKSKSLIEKENKNKNEFKQFLQVIIDKCYSSLDQEVDQIINEESHQDQLNSKRKLEEVVNLEITDKENLLSSSPRKQQKQEANIEEVQVSNQVEQSSPSRKESEIAIENETDNQVMQIEQIQLDETQKINIQDCLQEIEIEVIQDQNDISNDNQIVVQEDLINIEQPESPQFKELSDDEEEEVIVVISSNEKKDLVIDLRQTEHQNTALVEQQQQEQASFSSEKTLELVSSNLIEEQQQNKIETVCNSLDLQLKGGDNEAKENKIEILVLEKQNLCNNSVVEVIDVPQKNEPIKQEVLKGDQKDKNSSNEKRNQKSKQKTQKDQRRKNNGKEERNQQNNDKNGNQEHSQNSKNQEKKLGDEKKQEKFNDKQKQNSKISETRNSVELLQKSKGVHKDKQERNDQKGKRSKKSQKYKVF